jgi:hypothetical protein
MLQFQTDVFKGKWPVRGLLNLLNTLSKIWKQDLDLIEIQKEYDEYTETPEYQKWFKESENNEDTNEISNDRDPKGFKMYKQIANGEAFEIGFIMQIETIGKANPSDADL